MDLELMFPLIGAHPEKRCLQPDFSPNCASEQIKRGSPNSPPIYDSLGFEPDYKLLKDQISPEASLGPRNGKMFVIDSLPRRRE